MESYLEIRFGRECKMYTLWSVFIGDKFVTENYIKNLSTDYDKAISAAKEYNKEYTTEREIEIDAPEHLYDIVRGEDVLRFGKYKDHHVSELTDEKYLKWLCNGAQMKNNFDVWCETLYSDDPIVIAAKNRMIELGLAIYYNDRFMTIEYYNKIQKEIEKSKNSEFYGNVNDKIEINNVVCDKIIKIYGVFPAILYQFSNGNHIFTTKRSSSLSNIETYHCDINNVDIKSNDKIWKKLIHVGVTNGNLHTIICSDNEIIKTIEQIDTTNIEHANYFDLKTKKFYCLNLMTSNQCVKVGDIINIKATIKEHKIYKDTKQTSLTRVTII